MNCISVDTPVKRNGFVSVARISGDDFPKDATIEFTCERCSITIQPALVRPHWLLIDALPVGVQLGQNKVRVIGTDWASETVVVPVLGTTPEAARVLFPGAPSARPYTVAFVANPAITRPDKTIVADPVMTDRPAFVRAVVSCLKSYLTLDEPLMRRQDLERLVRFVVVFDEASPTDVPHSLAFEYEYEDSPCKGPERAMGPERQRAAAYLSAYTLEADVVVVIHGSTTHTGATSPATTDDMSANTVPYEYDGRKKLHGLYASIPGATALSIYDHQAPTPLHEFGHAASEYGTGFIIDAYSDTASRTKFMINKKQREKAGDPLPRMFCTYQGKKYDVDPSPGGHPYDPKWFSYLPAPVVANEYNLMDNYPKACKPNRCRFDTLTHEWLFDRLWAKANR